jgi:adenylate cyclase
LNRTCGPPLRCFQGVVPAVIATAAKDGTPNVTYLSQVFNIDERHVALSCQFFNKTKQNVLENPVATVKLMDPVTLETYRLELSYLHAEESGPLFEAMSVRIQAIASQTGMVGIFRLVSADVYEVLSCEKEEHFIEVPETIEEDDPGGVRSELRGLQLLSQLACRAQDLDAMLSAVLDTLDKALGFEHAMFFVPDEMHENLFAVASRGYRDAGIGAEVRVGEGLVGTVAKERKVLRLSGVESELRYGRAIRTTVEQTAARRELRPEIPLPGLVDAQSHLALPLALGDRLVGVLAVESKRQLGFDEWDEAFLEIVANQLALAIDHVLVRERSKPEAPIDASPRALVQAVGPTKRFRFFRNDDCVFVGDEYLIRNVPGRILWKLLRAFVDSGRTEFSNRELRLDPWLGLPALRDNLESRLVLLRKRLEQKCPEVSMPSTGRGYFRLEASCRIELEERDSG